MGGSGEMEERNSSTTRRDRELLLYDGVIIGASPYMLLEALRLEEAGQRVAVLDRRDVVGGAWYIADLGEFTEVEVGCHYIERCSTAYDLLEELLGTELVEMRPQPFALYRGLAFDRACAIPRKLNALHRGLESRNLKRIIYHCWDLVRHLRPAPRSDTPYRYPDRGCRSIVQALLTRLERSSVDLFLGTDVKAIEISEDRRSVACVTDSGLVRSTFVVVGSCTDVRELSVGGRPIEIQKKQMPHHNIILHLHGTKKRPFSYVESFGISLQRGNHHQPLASSSIGGGIARVSDIGFYSDHRERLEERGELLLCVHVPGEQWEGKDTDDFATNILDKLLRGRLVEKKATLVQAWREKYESPLMTQTELDRLKQEAGPALQTKFTFDLGLGMTSLADSWGSVECDQVATRAAPIAPKL